MSDVPAATTGALMAMLATCAFIARGMRRSAMVALAGLVLLEVLSGVRIDPFLLIIRNTVFVSLLMAFMARQNYHKN
jgi:hypothetical protein